MLQLLDQCLSGLGLGFGLAGGTLDGLEERVHLGDALRVPQRACELQLLLGDGGLQPHEHIVECEAELVCQPLLSPLGGAEEVFADLRDTEDGAEPTAAPKLPVDGPTRLAVAAGLLPADYTPIGEGQLHEERPLALGLRSPEHLGVADGRSAQVIGHAAREGQSDCLHHPALTGPVGASNEVGR